MQENRNSTKVVYLETSAQDLPDRDGDMFVIHNKIGYHLSNHRLAVTDSYCKFVGAYAWRRNTNLSRRAIK